MVDRHLPALLKNALLKEGPELRELIGRYVVTFKQRYEDICKIGHQWFSDSDEEYQPDAEYDQVSTIFNRFKAKCQKLLPEIPSDRKDSFGLVFEIRNQDPGMKLTSGGFERHFEAFWKIRKDSYDLADVKGVRNMPGGFNAENVASIYNLQIMNEFIDKSLEAVQKFPVT
jgi:hypothetical protein